MSWSLVWRLSVASLLGAAALLAAAPGQDARSAQAVYAVDSADWQQTNPGLSIGGSPDKSTAGLALRVKADTAPTLFAQGGVNDGGWVRLASTAGIELGQVTIPGSSTASLTDENSDWSHDEATFTTDLGQQLKIQVSRLSPAVLIQSQASSLRLLSGGVTGATTNGTRVTNRPAAPAAPKYVAFPTTRGIEVSALSSDALSFADLSENWLLVWYAGSSYFTDTRVPMQYTGVPHTSAYQADVPLLLVFQNKPAAVVQAASGGIDVSFSGTSGYVSVMPLFGRDHPRAADTELWSRGLPAQVIESIDFWVNHACYFPSSVSEDYLYDPADDAVIVEESIGFTQICSVGAPFSPIPPTLALARHALGVTFSQAVLDTSMRTEFGPLWGIEDAASYSWTVSGLRAYTDSRRVALHPEAVPSVLQNELAAQARKVVEAGHLKPWLFSDSLPMSSTRGDVYFLNPSDVLYHLSEVAETLPANSRAALVDYIRNERAQYPPETVYNLPNSGSLRGPFGLDNYASWQQQRPDLFLARVPLYSYYGLARYYELAGETVSPSLVTLATQALDRDLEGADWATFGWFRGYSGEHSAVVAANRHLAGTVGLVKLAKLAGDAESSAYARAMLTKALALRIGMARYPRYLYSSDLVRLPSSPDWQPKYTAGQWEGYITNYNWSSPYDDAQQVAILDQYGVYLADSDGFMAPGTGLSQWVYATSPGLSAYRDMVPEVFHALADLANADISIASNKVSTQYPTWYVPFSEGTLGWEHNLAHPSDSFQTFMAKALIERESGDALARYASFPWVDTGDLFYMQKLAEAANSYAGTVWQEY